jgi:ferritin-like metal-binding protein YciE
MQINSLTDVLVEELGDLLSGEQQLVDGLPRMASAAHAYALRDAFESHLEETRRHVERLEQSFAEMGIRFAPTRTSNGMRGLLQDSEGLTGATGDSVAIDAGLIGAAQRIEHYEIAGYGTARALADELGLDQVRALLDQTLDEEGNANKLLTKLAAGGFLSSGINRLAAARTVSDQDSGDLAPAEEPSMPRA